jgi:hypothetical protein
MDHGWSEIQKAEVVVVDFADRSPNVMLEYGLARVLNKRVLRLTVDEQDIPSDDRGYRFEPPTF